MTAASRDPNETVVGTAQAAFLAAQQKAVSDAPVMPKEDVPLDALIGQEVARQVAGRGVRRAAEGIDAAVVGLEPEVVGERGSRLRRCIVTGEVRPHEEMIRFVIGPQNIITPDLEESLPGRGYWVTARHDCLQKAIAGDAFSRAAQQKVVIPPALMDQVIVLARRACLATLGLARRAWAADFGLENVRQTLIARKAGLLLIAHNAPADVQGRIDTLRGDVPVIKLFNTAELSAAFGRESLAFAAIHRGQWTLRLTIETNRLAQLLGVS